MTKRFGFTLAEVLITLGIIGVVAAMTIPTLISNTNGAQFKTAYKKALSTLNQAVLMNVAMDDTDFSGMVAADADAGTKIADFLGARLQTASDITDQYDDETAPALTTYKVDGSDVTVPQTTAIDTVYAFADGTAFGFSAAAASCTKAAPCYGYIDVNGTAGPNQQTECDAGTGTTGDDGVACEVSASAVKDIFPVLFYGQTVEPASDAAKAVLFGK